MSTQSSPCKYGYEYSEYPMRARPQVLPNDMEARRNFVTSGGLKKVQELQAEQVPREYPSVSTPSTRA